MKLTDVKTSTFRGGSSDASTQAAQVNAQQSAQTVKDLNQNARRFNIKPAATNLDQRSAP